MEEKKRNKRVQVLDAGKAKPISVSSNDAYRLVKKQNKEHKEEKASEEKTLNDLINNGGSCSEENLVVNDEIKVPKIAYILLIAILIILIIIIIFELPMLRDLL